MRRPALPALALAALLVPLAAVPAGSVDLCFGKAPTIHAESGTLTLGTAGADVILGTEGDDTIRGLGGNDRICGLGGNDVLVGNAGKDRLDGGGGRDRLSGGPGTGNILLGGPGNDTILASSPSDAVRGGGGDDTIDGRATSFSVLRGGAGRDRIFSGYRSDLDAGAQVDHCGLGLAVAGTNCETVELLCGSGGEPLPPPPVLLVGLTSAPGDFDGDGLGDTLYVWKSGGGWLTHIETAGGFGAEAVLPTPGAEAAEAVGGHDINGDGIDEAFVRVGSGAYTRIVGLYTLYEPIGSPATGFSCGLEAVTFFGVPARAEFAVGASVSNAGGLVCQANGTLRELQQSTTDGVTFGQERYDYPYTPGFGVAPPQLGMPAASAVVLTWPTDQAAIQQAGQLHCGSLTL